MFNVCKISFGLFLMCLIGFYGSQILVSQTTLHMTTGMFCFRFFKLCIKHNLQQTKTKLFKGNEDGNFLFSVTI